MAQDSQETLSHVVKKSHAQAACWPTFPLNSSQSLLICPTNPLNPRQVLSCLCHWPLHSRQEMRPFCHWQNWTSSHRHSLHLPSTPVICSRYFYPWLTKRSEGQWISYTGSQDCRSRDQTLDPGQREGRRRKLTHLLFLSYLRFISYFSLILGQSAAHLPTDRPGDSMSYFNSSPQTGKPLTHSRINRQRNLHVTVSWKSPLYIYYLSQKVSLPKSA